MWGCWHERDAEQGHRCGRSGARRSVAVRSDCPGVGARCTIAIMTTAVTPRPTKRRDYARIALKAAESSLQAQTDAHVAVLKAADRLADSADAVTAAQAAHELARVEHAQATAKLSALIGPDEAALRLEVTVAAVRAATKLSAAATSTTPG
jgi:hypothetical protein